MDVLFLLGCEAKFDTFSVEVLYWDLRHAVLEHDCTVGGISQCVFANFKPGAIGKADSFEARLALPMFERETWKRPICGLHLLWSSYHPKDPTLDGTLRQCLMLGHGIDFNVEWPLGLNIFQRVHSSRKF